MLSPNNRSIIHNLVLQLVELVFECEVVDYTSELWHLSCLNSIAYVLWFRGHGPIILWHCNDIT